MENKIEECSNGFRSDLTDEDRDELRTAQHYFLAKGYDVFCEPYDMGSKLGFGVRKNGYQYARPINGDISAQDIILTVEEGFNHE